jgi:hypothetical protein
VLRYGFRTTKGKTGGFKFEAFDIATTASNAVLKSDQRILLMQKTNVSLELQARLIQEMVMRKLEKLTPFCRCSNGQVWGSSLQFSAATPH